MRHLINSLTYTSDDSLNAQKCSLIDYFSALAYNEQSIARRIPGTGTMYSFEWNNVHFECKAEIL